MNHSFQTLVHPRDAFKGKPAIRSGEREPQLRMQPNNLLVINSFFIHSPFAYGEYSTTFLL